MLNILNFEGIVKVEKENKEGDERSGSRNSKKKE